MVYYTTKGSKEQHGTFTAALASVKHYPTQIDEHWILDGHHTIRGSWEVYGDGRQPRLAT